MRSKITLFRTPVTATLDALSDATDPCVHIIHRYTDDNQYYVLSLLNCCNSGINWPLICLFLQMVWATSNKVGCAVHTCHNMNVWGAVWKRATYLVCNYSPK